MFDRAQLHQRTQVLSQNHNLTNRNQKGFPTAKPFVFERQTSLDKYDPRTNLLLQNKARSS